MNASLSGSWISLLREIGSKMASLSSSSYSLISLSLFGSTGDRHAVSSCTSQYQHYYTVETLFPLGTLGLCPFRPHWDFQVNYVVPPSLSTHLYLEAGYLFEGG